MTNKFYFSPRINGLQCFHSVPEEGNDVQMKTVKEQQRFQLGILL